ncbi:hypothetical protein [Haloferula sp. BvORR071]|uniref:hypothetical protein n=1 Tax=Haloferula sp. BvORR071 TaxID=1396141 RepID=UPI000556B0E0|nr:hypothetical protein [Haloferula sp. BvORR071]
MAVSGALFLRLGSPAPAPQAAAIAPRAAETAAPRSARARIQEEWQTILSACENGASPEDTRRQLIALKRRWMQEDDLHLVAEMCGHLLRGGADAKTGIPFQVGGSSLKGWPTMRVFLLDTMCMADPDLACAIAREVLATTGSAEEYAVALKPLTLKGPWRASDAELEGHFATMLSKPEWQSSDGLAEGLDLARNLGTSAATETLAAWLKTSPPARELGQMAIHETAAEHPQLVVDLMSHQAGMLEGQPALRASLIARASVSEQAQAGMVEDYLQNPAVSVQEKREFLNLYPLRSASSGYRLYGKPPAPYEHGAVVQDDQAALAAVTRWKADPALAELLPDMNKLEGRLQTWVKQAEQDKE